MIWSVKHSWKACDSVLNKQHSSQTCALGWLQGEKVKCRIKGPFARRGYASRLTTRCNWCIQLYLKRQAVANVTKQGDDTFFTIFNFLFSV